ncbi:MAG: hypothetical protein QOI56_1510, partial [Actinomycetota bacterium]|nr:hypothetical protein [Actinomycetota bacterium]
MAARRRIVEDVPTSGSDLDGARRLVVERGLERAAFGYLTVDAMMALPLDALGPTKALLKRFFSTGPWTPADAEALADAVGPGEGTWRHDLDPDVVLEYGWSGGRFQVAMAAGAPAPEPEAPEPVAVAGSLAGTFDGPVVPEATPNPRSIRFHVGPIPAGPGPRGSGGGRPRRWYESAGAAADDPGAARLFAEFDEVANVLV